MNRPLNTAVTVAEVQVPELTDQQVQRIVTAAQNARSPSTRRNYAAAWKGFTTWASEQGHSYLPAAPETAALYLAERADAGLSRSTLAVARAAISQQHREAGLADPTANEGVKEVLKGLTRELARAGRNRQKQATPLTAEGLAAIRATAHQRRSGPTGRTESEEAARSRGDTDLAICSVMRDCLLRRSEAAALRWADITFRDDGTARAVIRIAKGDQNAEGDVAFIGRAAAKALKTIRPEEPVPEGRVFGLRSGRAISMRIAAAAKAAGLEGNYSGHSPRVGFALDLVAAGFSVAQIQLAGRWKSPRMVATYARNEIAGQGAVAAFYRAKDE